MHQSIDPPAANSDRLKKYVTLTLGVQIFLSLSLLALAMLSDRTVQIAHDYAKLALEQRLAFKKTGATSTALIAEVQSPTPNLEVVSKLQRRLQAERGQVRVLARKLEDAAENRTGIQLGLLRGNVPRYNATLTELRLFLDDLETLGAAPFNWLLVGRDATRRVENAISPVGSLATDIRAIASSVQARADGLTQNLKTLRFVIVATMVGIVVALGWLLILPALRDLAAAIAREQSLSQDLKRMSREDQMTGILNRKGLDDAVRQVGPKASYGFAIVDLNTFKPINDTFGHAAGDAVLIEVARRLQTAFESKVTVARLGGDEFGVLDPTIETLDGCDALGAAIVQIFDAPIEFEERSFFMTACIGIAHTSQVGVDFDAINTAADAAMFDLKGSDLTRFAVYGPECASIIPDLKRKEALRIAMRGGQLEAWFQPKLRLNDRSLCGFEALARWDHPEQGVLMPGSFLEDLKRYQQMLELTHKVLRQSLGQLRAWKSAGLDLKPISVNVAADLLASEQAVEELVWLLTEHKDVVPFLTLELTEDIFVGRIAEAVRRAIERLTALNVRISLDDFGSGYASFRHLSEFPLQELKIHESLVENVSANGSATAILTAYLSLAKELKLDVVAEGIETEAQCAALTELGCDIGQGFLFAPALKPSKATEFLSETTNMVALG